VGAGAGERPLSEKDRPMTLAQLSQATQSRINTLTERFNDKKGWHISEIVSLYADDVAVSPEHLLVGLKGKQNVGTAYAAWYVHKSGVDAKAMNITFIANNYSSIQVKSSPEAMRAELARVSSLAMDESKSLAMADAQAGTAIIAQLEALSNQFDKVAKTIVVPTPASDALVMGLKVKFEKLIADYQATKVQEKEPINA
jgi:hypothetical protein